jgi:hypothetical protein
MSRTKQPEHSYRAAQSVLSQTVKTKPVILRLPDAHPRQYQLITALDKNPGLRFILGACGTKPPAPRLLSHIGTR